MYCKWPFIVDLPIKHRDFPWLWKNNKSNIHFSDMCRIPHKDLRFWPLLNPEFPCLGTSRFSGWFSLSASSFPSWKRYSQTIYLGNILSNLNNSETSFLFISMSKSNHLCFGTWRIIGWAVLHFCAKNLCQIHHAPKKPWKHQPLASPSPASGKLM